MDNVDDQILSDDAIQTPPKNQEAQVESEQSVIEPEKQPDKGPHITLADVDLSKTKYEIYAESSIGGRSENQDYYSAIDTPYGLVLIVCDGMGGASGGAIASKLAVNTIIKCIEEYTDFTTPSDMLREAVTQANLTLYQHSIAEPQLRGMGTTVVAMLLSEDKATVVHVGDSRLYQIRNGAKIFRTYDHSMVFKLVSEGRLTEEEARVSSGSNVILQAVGTKPIVDNIEIDDDIPYLDGDRFLLCTDGVWGALPESELLELATKDISVKDNVSRLIQDVDAIGANSGGDHDNLTAIILDVRNSSKLRAKKSGITGWIYALIVLAILVVTSAIWAWFSLV